MFVQQSTTFTIRVGPMINNLDGSANTTATLTVRRSINGGATAARSDATAITHDADGFYLVTLNATDTATIGRLDIYATATGCQTVRVPLFVLASAVFTWLTGTGTPTTTTGAVGSVTGAVGSVTGAVGSVTGAVGSIAANGISAASIATGAITAAKFAASAIDNAAIATGAISAAKFAAGAIDAASIATGAITAAKFAAGAIDASAFSQAAADRAWSTATRVLTAGTNIVLAKGTGVTGFNDPTAAAVATAVWSEPIPGSFGAGTAGLRLNAAASAGDPWATALPGSYGAGTAGNILGNRLDAAITSRQASGNVTVGGFAAGAITSGAFATGAIDANAFAQSAADEVWLSTTRTLTSGVNIALAKGTGLTGLNDIAAADVWGVTRAGNATAGTFGQGVASVQGNVTGSVASVTGAVSINLSQTGLSPRNLGSVADASLTVGDALVCAIAGAAGRESITGTTYVIQTPSTATTIRSFTLDSATTPTSRT